MDGGNDWYKTWIEPVEERMIRSVWRIVQNPEDAEDVLQNAVTNVWKNLDRVKAHPNPQALVVRIAVDAARDWMRSKIRRSKILTAWKFPFGIADRCPSVKKTLQDGEIEAEIIRAIFQLPKNQSTAVFMRIVEELPYEEIAQSMNCSETTVRIHVSRGKAKLNRWLSHLLPDSERRVTGHERESQAL